ncbi:hypothetical protein [Thalassoroseus pseudoceratinae]|uniref:hypothetical protein n=1 Tax=Thalassoroseus pseudoceratinae TaxID=2713176 RepID=UPI0014211A27|nr:hypothetical protein [Thalassoroseus pseudoceratinae]
MTDPNYKWANLTTLGRMFGTTSHVTGKWLVECGLRTEDKKPSKKAFDENFVTTTNTGRGSGYYYVWDKDKTASALEAAGHKRAELDD